MGSPWVVFRQGMLLRWGGDLRRRHLLNALVERTGARVLEDRSPTTITAALGGRRRWRLPGQKSLVASTELLLDQHLAIVKRLAKPAVVDVHDEPILQARMLNLPLEPAAATAIESRLRANLRSFPVHVAPSVSFVDLAGMDASRTIVAPNGSDPGHVRVEPWPDQPVVGCVSGAAPGRGFETLIAAAASARLEVPDLRLVLWLTATSAVGAAYMAGLRERVERDAWIEILTVPYQELSKALGRAAVLCVPHPANDYLDAALPVKLFDSMAAGRPVVVTPRLETAVLVRRRQSGIVTTGDRAEDLAAALVELLTDDQLARRLGANARRAVEEEFDWRVIGERLADEILLRIH